jgi:hypothetical protein
MLTKRTFSLRTFLSAAFVVVPLLWFAFRPTVPVSGRITYRGSAVTGSMLMVAALDSQVESKAWTGEDGRFEFESGLPPGRYLVWIGQSRHFRMQDIVFPIPEHFRDPSINKLRLDVSRIPWRNYDFELR